LRDIRTPLRVAVMGCVVNGPGESRDADIGVAAGRGVGVIFVKGQVLRKVPEGEIVDALMAEIARISLPA
jgi:(E)-4-hydroxy-3-methylbut-2-enyl-diphosphate synthase